MKKKKPTKIKIHTLKFAKTLGEEPKNPFNIKRFRKLAEEVKKTFTDEDLQRFQSS